MNLKTNFLTSSLSRICNFHSNGNNLRGSRCCTNPHLSAGMGWWLWLVHLSAYSLPASQAAGSDEHLGWRLPSCPSLSCKMPTASLFVFTSSEMTRFKTFTVISVCLVSDSERTDAAATRGPNPEAPEISVSWRKNTHANNLTLAPKTVKLVLCNGSELFFINLKSRQRNYARINKFLSSLICRSR